MRDQGTRALRCDACEKPIDEKDEYWWGRHGGEWHPDCHDKILDGGGWIVGMYMNKTEERGKLESKHRRIKEKATTLYELVLNPCPNIERGDSGWCRCDICGARAQVLEYIKGESDE